MLANAGANVIGYSTCREKGVSLFDLCGVKNQIIHVKGDVRDLPRLKAVFDEYRPEIVIHMAAQPIVREAYLNPAGTYSVNVMGTVNVLESVRLSSSVKSAVNVTTDKVYENKEWEWGYRENEPLDGYDPYSNSKSCSELVTHSYKRSFFDERNIAVSTARAGNVIGGGDFAKDRIIPDCIRAALKNEDIIIRNPYSTRPYQHVLEPVYVYLMIAAEQYKDIKYAGCYNIGPDENDCFQTGKLAELFVKHWDGNIHLTEKYDGGPHEANYLKLDCSRLKSVFHWKPRWNLDHAVQKVVEWVKCWQSCGDVRACMNAQIEEYLRKMA